LEVSSLKWSAKFYREFAPVAQPGFRLLSNFYQDFVYQLLPGFRLLTFRLLPGFRLPGFRLHSFTFLPFAFEHLKLIWGGQGLCGPVLAALLLCAASGVAFKQQE